MKERLVERIVVDGAKQYADANREEIAAQREAAALRVRAKYAERLVGANLLVRLWLRLKMHHDLREANRLDKKPLLYKLNWSRVPNTQPQKLVVDVDDALQPNLRTVLHCKVRLLMPM